MKLNEANGIRAKGPLQHNPGGLTNRGAKNMTPAWEEQAGVAAVGLSLKIRRRS